MASIPHGGQLINRFVSDEYAKEILARAKDLPHIEIAQRDLDELFMIATGAFSPLKGFMNEEDYRKVVANMQLDCGLAWSIPVVLPIIDEDVTRIKGSHEVILTFNGQPQALMTVEDTFEREIAWEAKEVYGTDDKEHPGIAILYQLPKTLIGGPIKMLVNRERSGIDAYLLTPEETRAKFEEAGWNTIVAFQTRNPIHRAHEYLQKCALEYVDGLMIHPIVGATKKDDLPADMRLKSYEAILDKYYPLDRTLLATMKTAMRYAGPREAIFHAIIRKNYGCTHFIIGRDHAGVGDYYDTYAAHRIFDQDLPGLDIIPVRFDHAFYCRACGCMGTSKTCPHTDEDRVILSGTKVRELLKKGERPPEEFTRPEVADILIKHSQNQ